MTHSVYEPRFRRAAALLHGALYGIDHGHMESVPTFISHLGIAADLQSSPLDPSVEPCSREHAIQHRSYFTQLSASGNEEQPVSGPQLASELRDGCRVLLDAATR
ncbi:MAG: hypothetical protein K2R93_08855 [Gemmatimonadaceae bacterium]|nr:hypothetical protein [Gemmatimonadaceae bacterium]